MVLQSAPIGSIPYTGYAVGHGAAGKIALPVAPGQYIYSQFEHVAGVPARDGSSGVAVSKLQILNTLIEQLGRIKKQPEPGVGTIKNLSDDRIDALIRQYEGQLKQASAANKIMPYLPKPILDAGTFLDLSA